MSKCTYLTVWGLLLASGLCSGADSEHGEKAAAAIPEIFTVSSVAYRDFEKELLRNNRGTSEFQRYASDIQNYDITLSTQGKRYLVTFTVKPFHGTQSFGGVERYVVDRKTGAILEHAGEK